MDKELEDLIAWTIKETESISNIKLTNIQKLLVREMVTENTWPAIRSELILAAH